MKMDRRTFIKQAGFSAVGCSLLPVRGTFFADPFKPAVEMEDLLNRVLSEAVSQGAEYADVRFVTLRRQTLQIQNLLTSSITDIESIGFAIRVFSSGSFGFAATDRLTDQDMPRWVRSALENARERSRVFQENLTPPQTSGSTVWQSPSDIDPFEISLGEKIEFLQSLTRPAIDSPEIEFAVANMFLIQREQILLSTRGARLELKHLYTYPNFAVTAVSKKKGIIESRSSTLEPSAVGYEITRHYPFAEEVRQAVEEAREKIHAPSVSGGIYDLLIEPSHLWHVLDQTIAYHLDPDNIFLLTDNNPRERFLPPTAPGDIRIGSDSISIHADNTIAGGLATAPYDDEGNPSKPFTVVDRGIVKAVPSTNEDHGRHPLMLRPNAAFAESWNVPIRLRMPNLLLQPGSSDATLHRFISSIDHGLLIRGRGTIIHNYDRKAFMMYPPSAWLIEKGVLGKIVRNVSYQSRFPDFWESCQGVGRSEESRMGGDLWTSKGDPSQVTPHTVHCPPALFRSIQVIPAS